MRQRSIFTNMERIKIVNSILNDSFNLFSLLKTQELVSFFPIHNNYLLRGQKIAPLYKLLSEANYIQSKKLSIGELKLRKYFDRMEDEAENTDFDDEDSSLEVDTAINFLKPWRIPVDVVRNYFGEKIAIYFDFLSFYTKHLSYMAFISIFAQVLITYGNYEVFQNTKIIIAILNIVWCTSFLELWKREQNNFANRFGQKNVISEDIIRPDFKGTRIRSIITDELNEPYASSVKQRLRIAMTYFITFIFIVVVITAVISTFLLKQYFIECNCVNNNFFIINTVPSLINSIQIFVFNAIYQKVVMKFNNFENHRTFSSYENSHSLKTFLFIFVNTFNSFILIAFFDNSFPSLNLCTVSASQQKQIQRNQGNKNGPPPPPNGPPSIPSPGSLCYYALSDRVSTIFIVTMIKNIPELLTPLIMAKIADLSTKKDERPLVHVFMEIDAKIEKQLNLPNYGTVIEVDGTVDDYMELVIQFSFICLFSPAFPLAFLLSFANNVFEIQVDKIKLTRLSRRPVGKSAADIGVWQLLMEIVAYVGIFVNAGLITFTSPSLPADQLLQGFTFFLLAFLLIKYIITFLISDESPSAKKIAQRHKDLLKNVTNRSNHKNLNLEMVSQKPSFKIENVQNVVSEESEDSEEEKSK